jgi:diphosphomevalonate decarboxylase
LSLSKQSSPGEVAWGEASGPVNIALVKYWGKRNIDLNLPGSDSLSLTLDSPRVTCQIWPGQGEDQIFWTVDKKTWELTGMLMAPYLRVLKVVRTLREDPGPLLLRLSAPIMPARGFASSAAAMAGVAKALDLALNLGLGQEGLSILARIGSGSACRSVPGGLVWWKAGERPDGSDSHASSVFGPDYWSSLRLIFVDLVQGPKLVSSTEGMIRTAQSSPLYKAWLETCDSSIGLMIDAFRRRSLAALGAMAEENARSMHGVALAANPPVLYMSRETIYFIEALLRAREQGLRAWFTLDAGPNPVLLTTSQDQGEVEAFLTAGELSWSVHSCGPGVG